MRRRSRLVRAAGVRLRLCGSVAGARLAFLRQCFGGIVPCTNVILTLLRSGGPSKARLAEGRLELVQPDGLLVVTGKEGAVHPVERTGPENGWDLPRPTLASYLQ